MGNIVAHKIDRFSCAITKMIECLKLVVKVAKYKVIFCRVKLIFSSLKCVLPVHIKNSFWPIMEYTLLRKYYI